MCCTSPPTSLRRALATQRAELRGPNPRWIRVLNMDPQTFSIAPFAALACRFSGWRQRPRRASGGPKAPTSNTPLCCWLLDRERIRVERAEVAVLAGDRQQLGR